MIAIDGGGAILAGHSKAHFDHHRDQRVIDADGIVRAFVPHHQVERLDGHILTLHAPTLFSRLGNLLSLGSPRCCF